jgi:hypothetical protein
LRKYSPPPSEDIELPGFIERDVTLRAVNIFRMKLPLGYKMGYKLNRMSANFGGLGWTSISLKSKCYE